MPTTVGHALRHGCFECGIPDKDLVLGNNDVVNLGGAGFGGQGNVLDQVATGFT